MTYMYDVEASMSRWLYGGTKIRAI